MIGQSLALLAGVFASLATVAGKLAMSSEIADFFLGLCQKQMSSEMNPQCGEIIFGLRAIFFGMIFLFNAIMWTLFTKSLQKCSSSLVATVTNTASNFFTSALLGKLLFGEILTLRWWCGASMIVLGLLLIHRGSPKSKESDDKGKKVS
ncbi:unnamed protein product [Owenia fusiformis]|uniref:Transmembrane protein 42 n=1 Tax=Owenia fusiformis TaxID=6347 RepID=A0A8S4NGT4_OWEFU|nr:unnamed protein product [Owenia fusiformis]